MAKPLSNTFRGVANSLTPLLGLLEKGLAFDTRVLDSRKWQHHDPAFRRLNPDGMVPILLHEDSPSIVRW